MTRTTFSRSRLRIATSTAFVAGLIGVAAVLASAGGAATTAAPANTSPATLSGAPQEGQTLTATPGSYSGSTPITYTYQYVRCDKNGGSCADIAGATSSTTYKLTSADVNNTVRVTVTASNSDGATTSTSVPTGVIAGSTPPANTSLPTLSGTPQEGQTLQAWAGSYSGSAPTGYVYQYRRCDRHGGSCSNAGGTTTQNTFKLTSSDVGNTVRVQVTAGNNAGSTTTTSHASAVIQPAAVVAPPIVNGCPGGTGALNISQITSPARLAVDGQLASPVVIRRSTGDLVLRFHVSACNGRSVQNALVYTTAVPFQQFTVPPEATTDAAGWATITLHQSASFPASARQQLLVVFVRARKAGESPTGGVSASRLVSFPVRLNG